jgi:hypothetical protein
LPSLFRASRSGDEVQMSADTLGLLTRTDESFMSTKNTPLVNRREGEKFEECCSRAPE